MSTLPEQLRRPTVLASVDEERCRAADEIERLERSVEEWRMTSKGYVAVIGQIYQIAEGPDRDVEGDEVAAVRQLRRERDEMAKEIGRLQSLLVPCRMDSTEQQWAKSPYPPTVNDCLSILSAYICDRMPAEAIPDDEYFAAWENDARPILSAIYERIERLQAIVDRLPKTADGVPYLPGDPLYEPYTAKCGHTLVREWLGGHTVEVADGAGTHIARRFGHASGWLVRVEMCYSTREAAEKARQG